jgi:hypothetical protein
LPARKQLLLLLIVVDQTGYDLASLSAALFIINGQRTPYA